MLLCRKDRFSLATRYRVPHPLATYFWLVKGLRAIGGGSNDAAKGVLHAYNFTHTILPDLTQELKPGLVMLDNFPVVVGVNS
jgi:hypothetical protein